MFRKGFDDDTGPRELLDGRLVCSPHGLVICGKCCSDYSFMDEDEEEETDDDVINATWSPHGRRLEAQTSSHSNPPIPKELFGTPKGRGTGRVFPTKFDAPLTPSTLPTDLFVGIPTYAKLSR
jgi:ribonuclease HI